MTTAGKKNLFALVHLVYNDEGAPETSLWGASPASGGGEDTGLPDEISTSRIPPCMTLLLATGLPVFMKAGRWEQHENTSWCCFRMFFRKKSF